jgi:hypothetical protein
MFLGKTYQSQRWNQIQEREAAYAHVAASVKECSKMLSLEPRYRAANCGRSPRKGLVTIVEVMDKISLKI